MCTILDAAPPLPPPIPGSATGECDIVCQDLWFDMLMANIFPSSENDNDELIQEPPPSKPEMESSEWMEGGPEDENFSIFEFRDDFAA